ncbi:MAG: AAA family ATPase [Anaerolineae bacterium]|nr:AAA family ATPase [Anaerolineae bacterium]
MTRFPLLQTKLYIPPLRSDQVPRPRLIARLDAAFGQAVFARRLTLISAPAGFGKTMLVVEWVASCRIQGAGYKSTDASDSGSQQPAIFSPRLSTRFAWLSLDEGDNDPVRFWRYVVTALQTAWPDLGEVALVMLQAPQPPPIDAFLTALINDIASRADLTAVILVLDDLHLITERQVHGGLTFLLDHLPPQMHLVITTRADPPLPIASLRARGQLTELRQADLRFTDQETAALLIDLPLSPQDMAALGQITEGWVAGLQMAVLAMRSGGLPSLSPIPGDENRTARFIASLTGSQEYIADYFTDEVLDRQDEPVHRFLLHTSILDRLTGSLCDAVTGQRQGRQMLEQLRQANLFVVPQDGERQWYRYHRLFADLLRRRLDQAWPDLVSELHRRAGDWYERNGLLAQAIDHILSAHDVDRAAALIERVAETTMIRGETATILNWVTRLPDELVRTLPELCLFCAWSLLWSGQAIDTVEARLSHVQDGPPPFPAQAMALRAYIAILRGQMARAADLAHRALAQLPEESAFSRGMATWSLSVSSLVSGDAAGGSAALDRAIALCRESGNVMANVMTLSNLAEMYVQQGQLYQAETAYRRALELATDPDGRPLPIAGMPLIGLGDLYREWNDLYTAATLCNQGLAFTGKWSRIGISFDGYVALARVRQAQGDWASAQAVIHEAARIALASDVTDLDQIVVAIHQVQLELAQGGTENVQTAARWAAQHKVNERQLDLRLSDQSDLLSQLSQREQITRAWVLIALQQPDNALALLDPVLASMQASKIHSTRRAIDLYLLRALALQATGDTEQALGFLSQALSLAAPGGYVRIFLDKGALVAQLLYRAVERGIAPSYASVLLAAFEAEMAKQAGVSAGSSAEPTQTLLVEPLSEREVEVLHLIAEGLSNREIATRLVISLSTVKGHTANIYSKLGIHSRTRAVARAKTLGILA